MAEVRGLWVKPSVGADMVPKDELQLTLEDGVVGGAPTVKDRQVTVMTVESWQAACDEVGDVFDPGRRRANVLVDEVTVTEMTGRRLRIGETVLHICFETWPCEQMDEIQPGLRKALEIAWRGGACCEVVEGGVIRLGDSVELVP